METGKVLYDNINYAKNISLIKPTDALPSGQKLVIEKIVTHLFNEETRQFIFLVKWENHPPEQNTWESEETVFATDHFNQYKKLFNNGILPRCMMGYALKTKQNQYIGVNKPILSPQAYEQNEILR